LLSSSGGAVSLVSGFLSFSVWFSFVWYYTGRDLNDDLFPEYVYGMPGIDIRSCGKSDVYRSGIACPGWGMVVEE